MYWTSRRIGERRTLPFSEATKAAASAALQVAAGKVERLADRLPGLLSPLHRSRPLEARQGSLDQLVRRIPGRPDVVVLRARAR